MTLPRRIQLVKLLRAKGLRDVERMREEDLKEALSRLRVSLPGTHAGDDSPPSSGAFFARPAEAPPPLLDDSDDPYAAPRFREPKLFLPEGERTFLRAIAVKPRLLFCTWDVRNDVRTSLEGPVELQIFWRDFLGDAPSQHEVAHDAAAQAPAFRTAVELGSPGWYLSVPGDRLAVTAALVVTTSGRRLAESNVSLMPPARAAPPGPHWVASLPPSLDRRRLAERKLMKGESVELRRIGETDARGLDVDFEEPLPASAAAMRLPWLQALGAVPSSGALSSGALFSGALAKKPGETT